MDTFTKGLDFIREKAFADLSDRDYKHLKKIILTNRLLWIIGYATAWIIPNPFSMLCISISLHGNWTIVAHHIMHKGYDKIPSVPNRYRSQYFAQGWRRYINWLDWMYPPAWDYEHNVLHHFHLNEKIDPDLVQERIKFAIKTEWPLFFRYCYIFLYGIMWKPKYYAYNTMKAYHEKKDYDHQGKRFVFYRKATWLACHLPYIAVHFIIIPLLFLPLGWWAVLFVFINRLGAELLTNLHSFFTVVTNHAGDDILTQPFHFKSRKDFYLAQIEGSCNFTTGNVIGDYLQGYLNYQIEHHLFPDLPASQYPKIQPEVKKLCEQHNIPYRQENIFRRAKKMLRVTTRQVEMQATTREPTEK